MRRLHEAGRQQRLAAAGLLGVALILVALAQPSARGQTAHDVSVVDDDYQPGAITIAPGASVIWRNAGHKPHDVTALRGEFNSGRMHPGDVFSHTFETAGTYHYQCTIHWSMAGSVIVMEPTATPQPAATSEPGDEEPTGQPEQR
jgi:plastocyanin